MLYQLVEGHWLELVVKVTAGLGLRREEICGLKWESVDFQRRVVHIKEARTAYGATSRPEGDKKPLLHAHPVYA